MTSITQHYKGYLIRAQASLVGRGGPQRPSYARRYVPRAVVRSCLDKLGLGPAQDQWLEIRPHEMPDDNPYRAMQRAVQYARQYIDALDDELSGLRARQNDAQRCYLTQKSI
ncbi:hypothetical protein [Pandoraea sp.]|uniref:hypothetical protein n=1 Tax=Pandoraea sp. TaxID=1883445 RepID=UPI001218319E|nr:hypothetical protein [Pandoraea sp.]TAL55810.1 MAG: hypothetical protein EPN80_06055 [Pandoraea sp.]TAM15694.1 MAG: hypothetical protein EPN65_17650 [Pandoraea sp.]